MRLYELPITTDAVGAGTATTVYPLSGEIVGVRELGHTSGTADWTLTRTADGGTVLALTDVAAPWDRQPRSAAHSTTGGTTAYSTGVGPVYDGGIPIDGYLKAVVAQAGSVVAGTVYIYVE